jgi:hypothetical protein
MPFLFDGIGNSLFTFSSKKLQTLFFNGQLELVLKVPLTKLVPKQGSIGKEIKLRANGFR